MRFVEAMGIQDRQTVPQKRRHKAFWSKNRSLIVALLLFLLFASSSSFVASYRAYHIYKTDLVLAQTGMQHLRSAITFLRSLQNGPVALHAVKRAQQEFTDALGNAQTIQTSLASYSGIAGVVPVYNTRLVAAIRLAALAVDISLAGIGGCKLLETILTRLGGSLSVATPGLANTDFIGLSQEYQEVKATLDAAVNEALLLQPGDLSFNAHLAMLLREFQSNIPMVRSLLAQIDQVLPVLPILLGIATPAHFLLEIMDATELRPGGGFIGNYGIATVSGGRLTAARITDTYLLDRSFESAGRTIPYPPAYSWFGPYLAPSSWSLRDSNLDADFPTDARYGELNYQREGGNVPLQGVIAITPFFIEHILDITGPVSVPEYHQTVTAQNLIGLIHFYQLEVGGSSQISSSNGLSSQRKYFTSLLGEYLLARVTHLPSESVAKLLGLFVSSLHTKDIQVYFNAKSAENVLHLFYLDGTIQSPPEDHLFIVDANVAGDKANLLIGNTVYDQVTIGERGNVIHHTTITYAWVLPGQAYGNPFYHDYVRIYAPLGSILSSQNGWQSRGTSTAFGCQVWAGFFTLVRGQTIAITLVWTSHVAAKSDANEWHYQYLVQRQAGAQRTLELQATFPVCATVSNTEERQGPGGKQKATLTQSLGQDLNIDLDYSCR